jgi:1-acyl-sn-glycerol-3-phosphate acyltransferase
MLLRRVLSALFWTFLVVSSALLFPVALLIWAATAPFDPQLRLLHRFTSFWASLYTWLNPAWPVELIGREKIRDRATYVMIANHQSLLDILVLFRVFAHFKWVSKIENFRIPFIGWNMSLNRYIKLKRGDRSSVVRMMQECQRTLAGGNSIMMFPEGTRSPDGRLRAFKTGAFELAKAARVPILPIILEGTANALPKRGFVLQGRHPIRITILDEVPAASFAEESVEELTARMRELIARHLGEPAERPRSEPQASEARAPALASRGAAAQRAAGERSAG